MLPRVDKTLDLSSPLAIYLTIFSAHIVLQTCHKHKNTFVSIQMLLQMQDRELNSDIWAHKEISFNMGWNESKYQKKIICNTRKIVGVKLLNPQFLTLGH
jgi:hypothetical protein